MFKVELLIKIQPRKALRQNGETKLVFAIDVSVSKIESIVKDNYCPNSNHCILFDKSLSVFTNNISSSLGMLNFNQLVNSKFQNNIS